MEFLLLGRNGGMVRSTEEVGGARGYPWLCRALIIRRPCLGHFLILRRRCCRRCRRVFLNANAGSVVQALKDGILRRLQSVEISRKGIHGRVKLFRHSVPNLGHPFDEVFMTRMRVLM